jgi:adenylylsulfate kinase
MLRTAWFPGRFQPFHEGHKSMVLDMLKEYDFVMILMRHGQVDEKNPLDVGKRLNMIMGWIQAESLIGKVQVLPVDDPGYNMNIVYGRKVGYGIEERRLEEGIESISGTEIRKLAEKKLPKP